MGSSLPSACLFPAERLQSRDTPWFPRDSVWVGLGQGQARGVLTSFSSECDVQLGVEKRPQDLLALFWTHIRSSSNPRSCSVVLLRGHPRTLHMERWRFRETRALWKVRRHVGGLMESRASICRLPDRHCQKPPTMMCHQLPSVSGFLSDSLRFSHFFPNPPLKEQLTLG